MNYKGLFLLVFCALALTACADRRAELKTGADRDAHGCVASAGYTWSAVQGKCLRLWEEGIMLLNAQDAKASLAAYAVLSASGDKAELFIPGVKNHPTLTRSFTQEGPVWKGGAYELTRLPSRVELRENGVLTYASEQK